MKNGVQRCVCIRIIKKDKVGGGRNIVGVGENEGGGEKQVRIELIKGVGGGEFWDWREVNKIYGFNFNIKVNGVGGCNELGLKSKGVFVGLLNFRGRLLLSRVEVGSRKSGGLVQKGLEIQFRSLTFGCFCGEGGNGG